jgi:phage baseplate assembly protein W
MARYIDIDLNFIRHPMTHDIVKKYDEDAIKQSVKNLVLTNFYDKWNPDVGSNVSNLLFEPMTPVTTTSIHRSIEQTILNFEPRVEIININVTPNFENHQYDIQINFNIVNVENPIIVSFTLTQVR